MDNHTICRGQIGLGALIIFISVVLVATITAGILFDITGLLSDSADDTSDEAGAELTDRLEEVATTGDIENGSVARINVTVTLSEGASPLDLQEATVTWIGPEQAHTLRNADAVADPNATPVFEVIPVTDADGSFTRDSQLLTSQDDRYVIVLRPGGKTLQEYDNATVEAFAGAPLAPNEAATIELTTGPGASTDASVQVPPQLIGLENLEL